jgi:hypothetical protein
MVGKKLLFPVTAPVVRLPIAIVLTSLVMLDAVRLRLKAMAYVFAVSLMVSASRR